MRHDVELPTGDRSWGIHTFAGLSRHFPGRGGRPASLYGDVAQLVSEVYWRPQKFGDPGRFTARSCTAAPFSNGLQPPRCPRAERPPRRRRYSCQAAERSQPHARGRRRVRIGSLVQQRLVAAHIFGRHGTDLRADVPSWNTFNMYAEVGRFHSSQSRTTQDFRRPSGAQFPNGERLKTGAVSAQSWALITSSERTASGRSKARWRWRWCEHAFLLVPRKS